MEKKRAHPISDSRTAGPSVLFAQALLCPPRRIVHQRLCTTIYGAASAIGEAVRTLSEALICRLAGDEESTFPEAVEYKLHGEGSQQYARNSSDYICSR